MLGVSKDQDITNVNNNMQSLMMAKEKNRFNESRENPRGHSQTKRQNLGVAKQTIKINF